MIAALFASIAELVAFGTFGFFFLLTVAVIVIATEVQYEKGTGATLTLVGTILAVHFLSGLNVLVVLRDHLLWFLMGAVLFLVVGGVWSLIKIGVVASRIDSRYQRLRNDFCEKHHIANGLKISTQSKSIQEEWEKILKYQSIDIDSNDGSPTFDHHKHRQTVFMWIGHWPFSMLGTLCSDVVQHVIDTLYVKLDTTYGKIVKSILGKHAGDMPTYDQKRVALAKANVNPDDSHDGYQSHHGR